MDGSVTLTLILVWITYRMMIRTGRYNIYIYNLGELKGPWSTLFCERIRVDSTLFC